MSGNVIFLVLLIMDYSSVSDEAGTLTNAAFADICRSGVAQVSPAGVKTGSEQSGQNPNAKT